MDHNQNVNIHTVLVRISCIPLYLYFFIVNTAFHAWDLGIHEPPPERAHAGQKINVYFHGLGLLNYYS